MGVPALEALLVQIPWCQTFLLAHADLLSFGNQVFRVPTAILVMGSFALGGLNATGMCEMGKSMSLLSIALPTLWGLLFIKLFPGTPWPTTIFPALGAGPLMQFTWRLHWLEMPPRGVKNRARSYRFQMRLLRKLPVALVGITIGSWGVLLYNVLSK